MSGRLSGFSDRLMPSWVARAQYLRDIGALDQDGDLTDHGLELRSFADETDVANLMILADRLGCAVEMAILLPMRKLGGYTPLLLWDKGWDAPTKRAVNRIHQGLLRPCLDDLELSLKLWDAWEGVRFGRTDSRQRSTWAQRFFVNHNLFAEQIAAERDALLSSLSGHKKVETARPVDFDLLTRLRILMTYGLPSQIYQLGNPSQTGADMTEAPIYRPYIPNPEATPEAGPVARGSCGGDQPGVDLRRTGAPDLCVRQAGARQTAHVASRRSTNDHHCVIRDADQAAVAALYRSTRDRRRTTDCG